VLCAALSAHKFTLIFDFVVGVCRWHINPEMKDAITAARAANACLACRWHPAFLDGN